MTLTRRVSNQVWPQWFCNPSTRSVKSDLPRILSTEGSTVYLVTSSRVKGDSHCRGQHVTPSRFYGKQASVCCGWLSHKKNFKKIKKRNKERKKVREKKFAWKKILRMVLYHHFSWPLNFWDSGLVMNLNRVAVTIHFPGFSEWKMYTPGKQQGYTRHAVARPWHHAILVPKWPLLFVPQPRSFNKPRTYSKSLVNWL